MSTLTVGLRFDPRDERALRELTQRATAQELPANDVALFREAALAAHTGEPLIVQADSVEEVVAMADGFTMFGVRRPALDALAPGG